MVSGPPGAGKSTVARLLADSFPASALVPGDAFFGFLRAGAIPPWLPAADRQNAVVLAAAAAAAGRLSTDGRAVVYEGVVGPWHLPEFLAAAGVALGYVVLLPAEELCLARVASRTGHGFTDRDAARHMHRQFVAADLPARHLLRQPAGTPEDVVAAILDRLDRGDLRYAP